MARLSVPTSKLPFIGLSCDPGPGEVWGPQMFAPGSCTLVNPAPARMCGLGIKEGPAPLLQWVWVWQEARPPPDHIPP